MRKKPVKNGFRWPNPTRNGKMCHTFDKCGVYYFGDISGNESSSYIGIIAVKKKPQHLTISYNEETKRFDQELISTVESGDTIWWKWSKQYSITMNLIETNLVSDRKIEREKYKGSSLNEKCEDLQSNSLTRSGVYAYKIKYAGCYYFRVFNGMDEFTVTVIAPPAEKDHKVSITDSEAKPPIINIHPRDRVWFVWDEAKRPQNIRQVNHHNQLISNGFVSGALMEPPATFAERFENLGIYYYRSDNSKRILGAVVCVHEPSIQVVHVNESGISPDPIVIHANDLVVWEFHQFQSRDVIRVKSEKDCYDYNQKCREILPRRFLSKSFKEVGIYHFVSPSFDLTLDPQNIEKARGIYVIFLIH